MFACARRRAEEDGGHSNDTENAHDEVANLSTSLRTHLPNFRAACTPGSTKLVNLKWNEPNGKEDVRIFARTSFKAFVGMPEDPRHVRVMCVLHVTDKVTENASSYIPVLGPRGFYLCSCSRVLQHGCPCTHTFAVELLNGNRRRPTSFGAFRFSPSTRDCVKSLTRKVRNKPQVRRWIQR